MNLPVLTLVWLLASALLGERLGHTSMRSASVCWCWWRNWWDICLPAYLKLMKHINTHKLNLLAPITFKTNKCVSVDPILADQTLLMSFLSEASRARMEFEVGGRGSRRVLHLLYQNMKWQLSRNAGPTIYLGHSNSHSRHSQSRCA
jgi:hypothetical protein